MFGTIRYFSSEKQFGFVESEDGRQFYFRADPDAHLVEGARVRFERAERSDAAWARKVFGGKVRDLEGINPRNPRPPRQPWIKPSAVNVAVIEEGK